MLARRARAPPVRLLTARASRHLPAFDGIRASATLEIIMRRIAFRFQFLAFVVAGLSIVLTSFDASAHGPHRGRVGVGIHFGVPAPIYLGPRVYYGPRHYYGPSYYGPSYHYPPAYYYGAPAIVESAPVYVERGVNESAATSAESAQPAPAAAWYYCSEPEGYYPYVKQCPGGWRTVPAQPSANPQ